MKISHVLMIAVFLVATLATFKLIAQSSANQASQARFEYATLTTSVTNDEGGVTYELIWNAGVLDIIGRSTTSLLDARRRLTAQLGSGNVAQSNLSVLLTSLGRDGWRLVESDQDDAGLTRIFIRNAR